jgi:GNAT superfamily N-acetyltransferase
MRDPELRIRPATSDDIPLIHSFIIKKADFDRETGAFSGVLGASEARLRATLFGEHAFARVLLAEADRTPQGFALYYFRYSSFNAQPSVWLDDLYLDPMFRGHGVGAQLMSALSQVATDHGCSHLAWTASMQNPRGIAFYQRLGATIVDRTPRQVTFWLDAPAATRAVT